MADVQIRFSTTGAEQAAQSFAQVGQSSQRFAQTTQTSVSQARIATQAFSFVLLDISRIARATGGAAGKEFANSLDGAVIALSSARGAVAVFRGVLVSHELIMKEVTAATIALRASMLGLLGPVTVLSFVILAAAAAWAIYLYRQHQGNAATAEAHRLHHSLAHTVPISSTEQERLSIAVEG